MPNITIALKEDVITKVDEESRKMAFNRSRFIAYCISYYFDNPAAADNKNLALELQHKTELLNEKMGLLNEKDKRIEELSTSLDFLRHEFSQAMNLLSALTPKRELKLPWNK